MIVTGIQRLLAPQFSTDGTLDKATQHADTERLIRNNFIIAPEFARCNNFVGKCSAAGDAAADSGGSAIIISTTSVLAVACRSVSPPD
jgi:hypothetical protein